MNRFVRVSGSAVLAALVTSVGRAAAASEADPGLLKADLMLAMAPPCGVCHVASDAGEGAATTPFSMSLATHGFREGDAASLVQALAAMKKDDTDSDGDGATDLDELSWGGDPNVGDVPSSTPADRQEAQTGCHAARDGSPDAWSVGVIVAIVLSVLRKRRASKP